MGFGQRTAWAMSGFIIQWYDEGTLREERVDDIRASFARACSRARDAGYVRILGVGIISVLWDHAVLLLDDEAPQLYAPIAAAEADRMGFALKVKTSDDSRLASTSSDG